MEDSVQNVNLRLKLNAHSVLIQQDADTSIPIDETLQLNSNLHNAHGHMDNLLGSGTGILTGLRDQRSTLKVSA